MQHHRILPLLLAAALAACSKDKPSNNTASATITLAALPQAEVLINGKVVGMTPLTHTAPAGNHEVVLRAEAFEEHKTQLTLAAGDTTKLDCVLNATDPHDPVALAQLAAGLEIGEWSEFAEEVPHRGSKDATFVVPLYPRGDVRMGDLAEYRIDVGDAFEGTGKLVFKRGTKVLFESDFDPEELTTRAALPPAVRNALKSGAQITWGFIPTKGRAQTAKFKVVKDDPRLAKRIAGLEKRLKAHPPVTVSQMRAQLFLNKKLYLAAYLEGARALALAAKGETMPSQALAVMQSAAQRMRLKGTPLWDEIQGDIERVPARVKARRSHAKR